MTGTPGSVNWAGPPEPGWDNSRIYRELLGLDEPDCMRCPLLASAWAAVTAGVTMIDASAGGLGGCPFAPALAGNIATEEIVYLLENSGIGTGIDLDAALMAARLAEELVGHPAGSNLLRAGGVSEPLGTPAY